MDANPFDQYVGKFLGPNKIASLVDSGSVTPSGATVWKVTYDGGQNELVPAPMVVNCTTDKPVDYTALFLKKFEMFAPTVLSLFTDYALAQFEVEHAVNQLKHSVTQSLNRAISRKWYGSDEQFVEGYDPKQSFTLVEAHEALKDLGDGAGATEVHMPVPKAAVSPGGGTQNAAPTAPKA